MDDQLKARLIGAVVLVALAVILVPELLSGRKSVAPAEAQQGEGRSTRTVTIDLTGAAPAPAAVEPKPAPQPLPVTVAPEAQPSPRTVDVPVDQAPPEDTEPAEVEPLAAAPTAKAPLDKTPVKPAAAPAAKPESSVAKAPTAPAAEPKPAKAPAKGGWSVQVGAFGSSAAAGKLVADLKAAGYSAYVSPISRGGKTLHRVRVGPEAAKADAEKLAARLKDRKLPATVVAND